jgi:hypothetical protein
MTEHRFTPELIDQPALQGLSVERNARKENAYDLRYRLPCKSSRRRDCLVSGS